MTRRSASIDLELTCWENKDGPGTFSEEMDVIEIGIHLGRTENNLPNYSEYMPITPQLDSIDRFS